MTTAQAELAAAVSGYAARLHAVIGDRHHVASPLGAWLLLALAAPAARGEQLATLTEVLGCPAGQAAAAAAALLADPHPLVAAAAAVWSAPGAVSADWLAGLPAAVETGPVPDQAGADRWARDRSFRMIERFPVRLDEAVYLVLASALATRVSWRRPFELRAAGALGPASPWAGRLTRVLRTPRPAGQPEGHDPFIAAAGQLGDVAVHVASAAGGLLVVSVAASPDARPAGVLAAAHRLACEYAAGEVAARRSLFDLPLGEGPLWSLREQTSSQGRQERCTAVLPAWSASTEQSLLDPVLGFAAAKEALTSPADPWDARQAAVARYSRTGFEAAAVTGMAVAMTMRAPRPGLLRTAELRFGRPFAVVAVLQAKRSARPDPDSATSPWSGLPVFSAWVAEPEDAAPDDSAPEE